MGQRYKVRRHQGVRARPMVSLTLSPEEIEILKRLSDARGLSKSALVGQLLRALDAERKGRAA